MEDIVTAFKTLAGGETISGDMISSLFLTEDYAPYLLSHMPANGEHAFAYEPFVVSIFER